MVSSRPVAVRRGRIATGLALLGLVAAGLYARVAGLAAYPFSPDDAAHLSVAGAGHIGDVLAYAAREVAHPPALLVLLHGMLAVGEGERFLRGVSLTPGLASIPLAYLVGRRAFGSAAGMFLAFATTFAYAHVLLSQVIREYALLVLLLQGALLCLLARPERPRPGLAWLYAVLVTLAVLDHHSGLLAAAALGAIAVAARLSERPRSPAAASWLTANAAVAVACLASFLLWIRPLLASEFRSDAVSGYYSLGYPGGDPIAWLRNLVALFLYFSSPFHAAWALALLALVTAGTLLLLRRGRLDVALMALLPLAANAVLARLGLYPLYGSRHCVYLFPLLLLPAAFAVQQAWEGLLGPGEGRPRGSGWLRLAAAAAGATAALVALADVRAHDHYREIHALSEFPITRDDYRRTLEAFEREVGPGDLVLADDQVARYAFLESSIEARARLAPGLARVELRGRPLHYHDAPRLSFGSLQELGRFLAAVRRAVPRPASDRVWLLSLGYGHSVLFAIARDEVPVVPGASADPGVRRRELRTFRALRQGLDRSVGPRFVTGDREGGGVLYAVPWAAVEAAARGWSPPRGAR